MILEFEWDDNKNKANIIKHGISFETASYVFLDNNRIEKYDEIHSIDEDRYVTIGMIGNVTIIVMVVYTERENTIRIISARKATKREMEEYYDSKENN